MSSRWLERAFYGELFSEAEMQDLCGKLRSTLIEEPNVITVSGPSVIVGDIHGQFEDLLSLLETAKNQGADVARYHFVFLGDYVDRGAYSLKTFTLLACLRLTHRHTITLLRGNHETRNVTQVYGFYDECLTEYGNVTVWKECCSVFDALPLAAVRFKGWCCCCFLKPHSFFFFQIIDSKIFCVHGGLSPQLQKVEQLHLLNRNIEPPQEGLFADLLWSDPDEEGEKYSV